MMDASYKNTPELVSGCQSFACARQVAILRAGAISIASEVNL
jgi:hypothetical protein